MACLFREEVVAAWRVRLVLEDPLVAVLADLLSSLECPRGPELVSWSEERMSEIGKEDVWSSSVRSREGWRVLEEAEDG